MHWNCGSVNHSGSVQFRRSRKLRNKKVESKKNKTSTDGGTKPGFSQVSDGFSLSLTPCFDRSLRRLSPGLALITANEALLWTDGRYFLQAEQQLNDQWKLMRMGEDPAVDIWIAENLPKGAAIGVDPWCISVDTAQKWEFAFAKKQQKLIQMTKNLVDGVWTSRPLPEINPVVVHPLEFAGRLVEEKLKDIREKLVQEKASAVILTALDEVAWLFNIRGSDVTYSPVVHAYAIVTLTSAFFYVDNMKLSPEVSSYLEENCIEVRDYSAVKSDAALLASGQLTPSCSTKEIDHTISKNHQYSSGKPEMAMNNDVAEEECSNNITWIDPGTCCFALYSELDVDKVFMQPSPLALAKALKNPVEMEGLKHAHIRDGAAVVQYLVWLDQQPLTMHNSIQRMITICHWELE